MEIVYDMHLRSHDENARIIVDRMSGRYRESRVVSEERSTGLRAVVIPSDSEAEYLTRRLSAW